MTAVLGRVRVFWRKSARLTGGACGLRGVVVAAAVAVVAVPLTGAAREAGPTRVGGEVPGTAVVYRVSEAEQRAALAYWTPSRMVAAVRAAVPQAGILPKGLPPKAGLQAAHFTGVPTVGALFSLLDNKGYTAHTCTASVVDSPVGDIVLTAAHCVDWSGLSKDIVYVPDWHEVKGKVVMPYGRWAVQVIYVSPGWLTKQDKNTVQNPNLDFAFMTVAPVSKRQIQAVTGGLRVGFQLGYTHTIEVIGYNVGDSEPVRCATKSLQFIVGKGTKHPIEFLQFDCNGFWTGTSGGPWIIGYNGKSGTGTVFGVIGGYQRGGSTSAVSYSSYFGNDVRQLMETAEKKASGSA
jgi:V8-like Glu-specific endopeptidase